MFKRLLITWLAPMVSQTISGYVSGISHESRRQVVIDVLKEIKRSFLNSDDKTRRTIGKLLPFE